MNKLEFRMDIPAVTREYTPGSCRTSIKPMRLSPRHEMRPDSPALHAEQLRFPNQKHKEPQFAWLNSRETPTTLSQDEKNTDVTPGIKTARCTKNQIEMRPIFLALATEPPRGPHHRTTQKCKLGLAGKYRRFWKLSGSPGLFFYLTQWYWDS